MAPEYDPDSDSDFSSDEAQDIKVYLGLPDGPLEPEDESNPLVSRAGGRPAFLPRPIASTSSTRWPPQPEHVSSCKICGRDMEMLMQIFAPLEGSCYDRTLYIWGCARAKCQRARDSRCVRAFRTITYNARWAAKLEKQKAKEAARQERLAAKADAKKRAAEDAAKSQKINPFASGPSSTGAGGMFGVNPFTDSEPSSSFSQGTQADDRDDEHESDATDEDEAEDAELQFRIEEELAIKASLAEQEDKAAATADGRIAEVDPWKNKRRAYYKAPQYVSTIPEPSSSSSLSAATTGTKKKRNDNGTNGGAADAEAGDGACLTGPDGKPYAKEGYEKMFLSGIDSVFERFVDRVGRCSSQLIRYEFGGEPLPFSNKGETFKRFWRTKVQSQAIGAVRFDAEAAGTCAVCGSKRVFELQLMPNVVNLLRPEAVEGGDDDVEDESGNRTNKAATAGAAAVAGADEQARKRREIEAALARPIADPTVAQDLAASGIQRSTDQPSDPAAGPDDAAAKTGLAWSTVLVFVCEKDCVGPLGSDALEHCAEELAEVMWEHD